MTDSLQLIVSEIVTNALIHAGSDVDVRLRAFDDHVRLEVRDSGSNPPVPSPLALDEEENAEAEHGRGLLIVEALGGAWYSSPNGRGKTVSLDMPVEVPEASEEPHGRTVRRSPRTGANDVRSGPVCGPAAPRPVPPAQV